MNSDKDKKKAASILIEALPYIRQYQGKTIVIKYGGNAMLDQNLKNSFAQDLVLMHLVGIRPVVVHGGGPQISHYLERVGQGTHFENGLRVTNKKTMEIVEMVLGGQINKEIVNLINTNGGRAVGLTGKDDSFIRAKPIYESKTDNKDKQYVGGVEFINPEVIFALEKSGFIPVVAPIGVDSKYETYNINADTVAGVLAAQLGAEKLMLLTNTPGILNNKGELIRDLSEQESDRLHAAGVISGGMIPKVNCAFQAVREGVGSSLILDGRIPHAILLELFLEPGVGTLIHL